jgi:hypothetical protein
MWGIPQQRHHHPIFLKESNRRLDKIIVGHIPLVKAIELFLSGVKEERPTNRICMFDLFHIIGMRKALSEQLF